MARADFLSILYSKNKSALEFNFDALWMPSMYYYLSVSDIQYLHSITTSVRLAAKVEEKYRLIDQVMTYNGFKRFHAGTNRVVYKHLEDTRFVAKIAVSEIALSDNSHEFYNQQFLKPFVSKTFEYSPCGTVCFSERVQPITSAEEFASVAYDVYDMLTHCILGKYVLEDIGASAFMNYGIREGFGVCLLDYPFMYKLDSTKLFCAVPLIPGQKYPYCEGEIDYDLGFNNLVCTRCGRKYIAKELESKIKQNLIIIEGESKPMKVTIVKGDTVLFDPEMESSIIQKPEVASGKTEKSKNSQLGVSIMHSSKEEVPLAEDAVTTTAVNDVLSQSQESIEINPPVAKVEYNNYVSTTKSFVLDEF